MKMTDLRSRRGLIGGFLGLMIGSIAGKRSAQAAPPTSPDSMRALLAPDDTALTPFLTQPTRLDASQTSWIPDALKRMSTIRPGMTRADLKQEFHPAGGCYSGKAPVYSYNGCENFKVTVEFKSVRAPHRDATGYVMTPEDPKDIITKISRPYVDYFYMD